MYGTDGTHVNIVSVVLYCCTLLYGVVQCCIVLYRCTVLYCCAAIVVVSTQY